jgi:hypothetical protein
MEYSAGSCRKYLTNSVRLFALLLVVRFVCRFWLLAFLIRWKNNGMLLLTEWNWLNYEFRNLLYCDAFAHSSHRNSVHKIRFNQETYAWLMTAYTSASSRHSVAQGTPHAPLAVIILYLLTSWHFWANFTIILAPTGRIRFLQ